MKTWGKQACAVQNVQTCSSDHNMGEHSCYDAVQAACQTHERLLAWAQGKTEFHGRGAQGNHCMNALNCVSRKWSGSEGHGPLKKHQILRQQVTLSALQKLSDCATWHVKTPNSFTHPDYPA